MLQHNQWNFEAAVALRIVHRVLVSQLGERLGYKVFRELPEEVLSKDADSILHAVVAARHFAKVPDSAPVLLAVDELGKINEWGGSPTIFSPNWRISIVTSILQSLPTAALT